MQVINMIKSLVRLASRGLRALRRDGPRAFIRKIKERYIRNADYPSWILANEPKGLRLRDQRSKARGFKYKPLISLVMPVWKTPEKILNETISSVLEQTYGNFELCISDGNSGPEIQKILSDWAKKDPRIKIRFLDENQGIAVNSNEALSLAQGEFAAFLDHDDLLAPFALFEIVKLLQLDQTIDLFYSDEDKTNENKRRFDPFFKPDFSPDYLRGVNYMAHFLVIRKSIGDEIGWFRKGYDGAQDYDLILRAIEKTKHVWHVQKVLYHWRLWGESTAGGSDAKPYANTAGKKALQEHLNRIGVPGKVEDGYSPTFYRVRYELPSVPLISIIIPSHNHAEDLKRCIESILQKSTYPRFEIMMIENGSTEADTFSLYRQLEKDTRVHLKEWKSSFNYSSVNNWATTQANGDVFLFLNNDTAVINHDWLEEMLQFSLRPDVAAVGAKLYYPDGTIQHGGVIMGIGGVAGHSHKHFPRDYPGYFGQLVLPHNISAVTAACLMIRKQVFQEIHGFDENYVLAFGDVDICLRALERGYTNIWTPYAELFHHESKTRGYEDSLEKQARFRRETKYFHKNWKAWLKKGDPFYNPNLTLEHEDFSLNRFSPNETT